MRRARKGGFSFEFNRKKHVKSNKNDQTYLRINEEDKKDYQMKYFGRIIDEGEENGLPIENAEEIVNTEENIAPDITEDAVETEENSSDISDEESSEKNNDETSSEEIIEEIAEETADNNDAQTDGIVEDTAEITEDTDEEITETAEETPEQTESDEASDDTEDDDMIIVRKNGDEKIEVVGKQNDPENQDSDKGPARKRAKKFKKKHIVIFTISLIVIILASLLVFFAASMFDEKEPTPVDDGTAEITQDYMQPVDEVTGKVNVLVLGVDKAGLRTDTIIVASIDTDTNKINTLSIPRDTRMYVGSRYQKINAAHAITQSGKIKGPQGSVEAVTRLTGIPINYYVEFSFNAFRETIDALGGVYFDVPQNMNYEDPTQDLYIHLKKGYQLLDGNKAEQLVRFRRYPEGDIKRVQVQQTFIKSVAEQKLNAGIITKLPALYKTLSKNIKTNFTLGDMTKYAPVLLKLDPANINMYSLPGEYSAGRYEASYWLANMDEVATLVTDTFGYDASKITTGKPGSSDHLENLAHEGVQSSAEADEEALKEVNSIEAIKVTPKPTVKATATPKATVKATKKPTSTPKATKKPQSTPKATKKPQSTPKATKKPQATQKPTSTPHNSTPTPVVTAPPSATVPVTTTAPTKEPETVSTPAPVETPAQTSTPEPVSTPEPTKAPVAETPSSGGTGGGFVRPPANE